jgi:hypothetical protein
MAEDEEEERQGPRPANDDGSPNGMSLDPRILRIACSTPKEDCKVRGIFPAFAHGAESLRVNSLIVAKSESPYERRESAIPCPHGCKPPQRTSKPLRIGLLATTSKRPVRFGNPMLSASSPVKMPAKWPATSLAFSPCCASGHAESGSVQDAESLRQLRHPHGGSVEDHARVRRQKIKCSLDVELICSLERGLIQYAVAARGRT